MGRLKAGGAGPGGGGAEGLQRAGGSWITSLMTVKVSRPLAFICVLLAVMQLSGAAQSAGAVEGEGRYLATPLAPVRPATPLPGPPNSPVATYAMEKPSGNYIPNLPYLRPHLDEAPNTLLRNNHSHQDNHRLPLQPIHHHSNHHNHHHSHHEPHHHHWEIEGATVYEEEEEDEEDEGEEDEERIETVKNVNGEGIFGRFSISSPHHHHKHHRQKQPPQPTMKRRSATSPARDEAGGYAFRVDEKSGVRRVIAVREAAGWGGEGGDPRSRNSLLDRPQDDATVGPPPGPSFDRNLPRNITIQAGKTAVLSCRVFNVNDKSVSWIRQDNLHILTVDKYKYSTDQRVSVLFNEPNLEWVLRIKSVTPADAGTYECQVSTKPILSFVVNMRVVDKLPTPAATHATPTPTPRPEVTEEEDTITGTARNASTGDHACADEASRTDGSTTTTSTTTTTTTATSTTVNQGWDTDSYFFHVNLHRVIERIQNKNKIEGIKGIKL